MHGIRIFSCKMKKKTKYHNLPQNEKPQEIWIEMHAIKIKYSGQHQCIITLKISWSHHTFSKYKHNEKWVCEMYLCKMNSALKYDDNPFLCTIMYFLLKCMTYLKYTSITYVSKNFTIALSSNYATAMD